MDGQPADGNVPERALELFDAKAAPRATRPTLHPIKTMEFATIGVRRLVQYPPRGGKYQMTPPRIAVEHAGAVKLFGMQQFSGIAGHHPEQSVKQRRPVR